MAAEVATNGSSPFNFGSQGSVPSQMERHGGHYRSISAVQSSHMKPQLPSFDRFVAGVGHPDLALRGDSRQYAGELYNNASPTHETNDSPRQQVSSPQEWHDYNKHTPSVEIDRPEYHDGRGSPHGHSELHRRSSIVLPISDVTGPKLNRSYSSNTTRPDIDPSSIWGPHRMPNERNVPGKGLYYVYDDGTSIPKTIDGNLVNPKWGTTKAGKPRKRLGQACNTCREKKIKCDPSWPKCSQCTKFNRECKFEAPTRSSMHKSPKMRNMGTSPTSGSIPEEQSDTRRSSVAPTEVSTPVEQMYHIQNKSSLSVDDFLSPNSQIKDEAQELPTPSKRQRLESSYKRDEPAVHDTDMRDLSSEPDSTGFGVNVDPTTAAEKLALDYLTAYVQSVNVNTFELFPQWHLFDWVRNTRHKKLQDLTMLYALLALATCHASNSEEERRRHRTVFSTIAHESLQRCMPKFSVQAVQASLLLGLSELADGKVSDAYTTLGLATLGSAYLQMNVEQPDSASQESLYGLSQAQSRECRRRTFWAIYCVGLYDNALQDNLSPLAAADIFLRLPCASELYEKDRIPEIPFFNGDNVISKHLSEGQLFQLGSMAYLAQLASICRDIQVETSRAVLSYRFGREMPDYKAHIKRMESRLQPWENGAMNKVEGFGWSRQGNKQAGLEIVYHYACMMLYRHVYHGRLTEAQISGYVKKAHQHAFSTLRLGEQILSAGGHTTADYTFATTNPLTGSAICMAIDIITAAGTIHELMQPESKTMQLMYKGIELLHQLSRTWKAGVCQHTIAKKRSTIVFGTANQMMMERKIAFYCSDPMMPGAPRELDIIYGSDRRIYLDAFGWTEGVTCGDEIHRIATDPKPSL